VHHGVRAIRSGFTHNSTLVRRFKWLAFLLLFLSIRLRFTGDAENDLIARMAELNEVRFVAELVRIRIAPQNLRSLTTSATYAGIQ
jgi:hypothetical protein